MSQNDVGFSDVHFIETSDGRRWTSLAAAWSPVMRLSATDTKTGAEYSPAEVEQFAPHGKARQESIYGRQTHHHRI
jgi:hypothetical protein